MLFVLWYCLLWSCTAKWQLHWQHTALQEFLNHFILQLQHTDGMSELLDGPVGLQWFAFVCWALAWMAGEIKLLCNIRFGRLAACRCRRCYKHDLASQKGPSSRTISNKETTSYKKHSVMPALDAMQCPLSVHKQIMNGFPALLLLCLNEAW